MSIFKIIGQLNLKISIILQSVYNIIRNTIMKLTNKITITDYNGSPKEIDHLDLIIVDHNPRKMVLCHIDPYPTPLILWKDKEYDEIGDYTQKNIEDRVLEILGNNPSIILQGLMFSKPQNNSAIPR